jgi:hypothetical protein
MPEIRSYIPKILKRRDLEPEPGQGHEQRQENDQNQTPYQREVERKEAQKREEKREKKERRKREKEQPRDQMQGARPYQPQQNEYQTALQAAGVAFYTVFPPERMANPQQHPGYGPLQNLLNTSEQSNIPPSSGLDVSHKSTQRTIDHLIESTAPVMREGRAERSSERLSGEEIRTAPSIYQSMDTAAGGQGHRSLHQTASEDIPPPVPAKGHPDPETRSADSRLLESEERDVSEHSSKSPLASESHVQVSFGNSIKVPETLTPMHEMMAAVQGSIDNQQGHHTRVGRRQSDEDEPESPLNDRQIQDEARYDKSKQLRRNTDRVRQSKEIEKLKNGYTIEIEKVRSELQTAYHEQSRLQQVIIENRSTIEGERLKLRLEQEENERLLQEKIRLQSAHEAEVSRNFRNHQNEMTRLSQGHKDEITRLNREHDDEVHGLEQDIEFEKKEAEKTEKKLETSYNQRISRAMDEHKIAMDQAKADRDQLAETERAERKKLQLVHDGRLAQVNARLVQLTEEGEEQRRKQQLAHDGQMAELIEEYENTVTQMKSTHASVVAQKNAELTQLRHDKDQQIARLKADHAAEIERRDAEYLQGTRQLREDVQRLNEALLTRDDEQYQGELFTTANLPTRPDEQIRARFSELEQMVDDLGRLQWKSEPAVWTGAVLRAVGGNRTDRVVKKAIVQDLVWGLLFTHIFCSPFRVFGAEGKLLEEEWNEQCGQGMYIPIRQRISIPTM